MGRTEPTIDPIRTCSKSAMTSVLSHQNIRINGFQFAARIVNVHLPIHAPLTPVDIGGPGGDFAAKSLKVAETATAEALAGHGAQLAFRDVQPASVLGCVAEHDTANQRPRPLRLKPFVESAFGVRVEVVQTTTTWEHAAYRPSSSLATSSAQSLFVRRGRAVACRHPDNGSQNMNTDAVPARSYS